MRRWTTTHLWTAALAAALAASTAAGVAVRAAGPSARTTTVAAKPTPDRGREPEPLRTLAAGGRCGKELWATKTLTDPLAGRVDLAAPLATSVDAIDRWPTPADPTTRRGDAYELHDYVVSAVLTGYKVEADSDVHMVLKDAASGKTIIGEIPDPACAAGSPALAQITQARAAFEAAHPIAGECFDCLSETVTVEGVGFFDRPHGQHGVADNAAELHPVLGFAVGAAPQPPPTGSTTSSSTETMTPAPRPEPGRGCRRWPGRHYYHGRYHRSCRRRYFRTP